MSEALTGFLIMTKAGREYLSINVEHNVPL